MTSPNRRLSLEEVLDAFFFSADAPDATMVARACDSYPEYREDIMEFAALWSSYEASPEPAPEALGEVNEEAIDRIQSQVLNFLHHQRQQAASDPDIEKVRASIDGLAGSKLRLAAKAASLGDSTLLLQKILSKQIRDVPRFVLSQLAQHLNVATRLFEEMLGPRLTGAISYKSSNKPNLPTIESWEEAVRALPVDEAEKKRLIALREKEPA
ncbi:MULTISPECIES: hypothetical protein [unclassified Variovorax]|uniref:hypothetical protein n=1 Tax=unclassified Variovorax TaxID=663243 RepID=UPI0002B634EA|nr:MULTISPECIES: hypothetical protein [unclassified Variovorax]AGF25483.1 hypothetical protein [Variovorax sp. WDL1]KWT98607.1 hypothetical protein APY03_0295 [Variovorax sp. WDL1]PNG50550.1 hypothetical protein CHC06_06174 [Variovorax sp. B2]PNG51419.1 hypothetical protein CHC07_06076 [Variovorax sp. B4]VTU42222.1 hypothetical protein RA8P1_00181 [Variovorax sp. RA8]